MLSHLRRLEIEMSRGYTYGICDFFKSDINCQILIFNFFYCKRLPEEGESSDPSLPDIQQTKNRAFSNVSSAISKSKK